MSPGDGTPWFRHAFAAGHFGEDREEMQRFTLDVLETGERLGVEMPVLRSFKERIAGPAA